MLISQSLRKSAHIYVKRWCCRSPTKSHLWHQNKNDILSIAKLVDRWGDNFGNRVRDYYHWWGINATPTLVLKNKFHWIKQLLNRKSSKKIPNFVIYLSTWHKSWWWRWWCLDPFTKRRWEKKKKNMSCWKVHVRRNVVRLAVGRSQEASLGLRQQKVTQNRDNFHLFSPCPKFLDCHTY